MSFFYIKLLAFLLLGNISTYYSEDCNLLKKECIIKIILLIIFVICFIGNSFLFIAKQLANSGNFNLANILAPYSLNIKKQELNKTKNINRKVELIQDIYNQEIWYENEYFFEELIRCAINEFENENIKNGVKILQLANNMLYDWENRYPLRLDNYLINCNILESSINKLRNWNYLDEVEDTTKNIENKIQKFVTQAKEKIFRYEITQMPKEEFEEEWKELMSYQK